MKSEFRQVQHLFKHDEGVNHPSLFRELIPLLIHLAKDVQSYRAFNNKPSISCGSFYNIVIKLTINIVEQY